MRSTPILPSVSPLAPSRALTGAKPNAGSLSFIGDTPSRLDRASRDKRLERRRKKQEIWLKAAGLRGSDIPSSAPSAARRAAGSATLEQRLGIFENLCVIEGERDAPPVLDPFGARRVRP